MVESAEPVAQILDAVEAGDADASDRLLPLVYDELRRLAALRLAGEAPGQTLQATELVHEAYLRLTRDPARVWNGLDHFVRTAVETMRRILVDRARRRLAEKRGQNPHHTEISDSKFAAVSPDEQLLAVHEALDRLARRDPVSAQLVELHYFGGLSMAATAAELGLSLRGAERLWTFAKIWLRHEIEAGGGPR